MITLDTSAVVALQDDRDKHHEEATTDLGALSLEAVLPAGILAEIGHMLARRDTRSMRRVLDSLMDGSLLLDCGDLDPPRIRELMARYEDLQLDFADAAVISCAERNGGRVMTFDRRDFEVVAAEGTITIVP